MERRTFAEVSPVAVVVIAIVIALALRPATAEAGPPRFVANLDVAQATTAQPGASGSGTMGAVLDGANLLQWNLEFSGLANGSQSVLRVHLHKGAPGETGPIEITIKDLPANPVKSPQIGSATITDQQEADLLAGLWYVNVHTSHSFLGEIRGQILQAGVGGIAELPEEARTPAETASSTGPNAGLATGVVAAIAAGTVTLGGAAWYARRRWQNS